MPLFEVAVLEKPTKDAADKGDAEKLVLGPVPVVAKDPDVAKILACKKLPDDVATDRLEVLVRPFVR
jgi:hypothetical protein